MDNASKALTMAGAILIAVMLISLGVYLFNVAQKPATDVEDQIDRISINAHNNIFTKYLTAGNDTKSGVEVNSLIDDIRTYTYGGKASFGTIAFEGPNGNDLNQKVSSSGRYRVTAEYYSEPPFGGCISKIIVQAAS